MADDVLKICVVAAADKLREDVYQAVQPLSHTELTTFRSGRDTLSYLRRKSTNLIIAFSDIDDMHWSTFIRSLYTDATVSYAPAVFFFERMLVEDRQHYQTLLSYGVSQIMQYPADMKSLHQVINHSVNDAKSVESLHGRLNKARAMFRDGMLAEAKATLRLLQSEHPKHLGIKATALQILRSDPKKFSDFLLQLIESDPANYHFQFELLANYLTTGWLGLFIDLFDDLMDEIRFAKDSYWLSQLGAVCVGMRSPYLAEVFEHRLAQSVGDQEQWMLELLRARIGVLQKDVETAKWHLDQAVASYGFERPEMLNLKAIIARRRGELTQAVSALLQALKLTPEDYRLRYNVALIELERGDSAKAIKHLQAALALNPSYSKAADKLRELTR
jgi:tetratricopeptide (TPR) repeat protein